MRRLSIAVIIGIVASSLTASNCLAVVLDVYYNIYCSKPFYEQLTNTRFAGRIDRFLVVADPNSYFEPVQQGDQIYIPNGYAGELVLRTFIRYINDTQSITKIVNSRFDHFTHMFRNGTILSGSPDQDTQGTFRYHVDMVQHSFQLAPGKPETRNM